MLSFYWPVLGFWASGPFRIWEAENPLNCSQLVKQIAFSVRRQRPLLWCISDRENIAKANENKKERYKVKKDILQPNPL